MCNRSAAIQAEAERNKIEEEDVHIIAEDLLPNAEMLLNINTQIKAKKYFSLDAWKTVESILSVLEDINLKSTKRKELPPEVSNKKGKVQGKSSLNNTNDTIDSIRRRQKDSRTEKNEWITIAMDNKERFKTFIESHKPINGIQFNFHRI